MPLPIRKRFFFILFSFSSAFILLAKENKGIFCLCGYHLFLLLKSPSNIKIQRFVTKAVTKQFK